jgi:hypothetical protein
MEKKKNLTDEQRQLYLKGLIEKIEAKLNPKTRVHELEIHLQHPIVGDEIKWKDPKKKTLGYKVLNGSKTTFLRVEKRDGRGNPQPHYSTVTLFARFLGLSTSVPRAQAVW